MGLLHQIFSLNDLKKLNLTQLELLKTAIQDELRKTSAREAVVNAIRARIQQVYDELTESGAESARKPPEAP